MSSNLPPGVSVGQIPGNRPEDEWLDTFMENIKVPDDLVLAIDPKVLSSMLNVLLAFTSATRAEAFEAGRQEEKLDMPFAGRQLENDPPVTFALIQCEAIHPELHVRCDREGGHHGYHHWVDESKPAGEVDESWWKNDDS